MPQPAGLLLRPKARFTLGKKTGGLDATAKETGKAAPGQEQDAAVAPSTPPKRGNSGPLADEGAGQRTKMEPLAYLEPKVMVPFEVPPGAVPRRVEVDRRKRLFASQDLPSLVAEKGVDLQEASAFRVEVFDNTDHEQRLPAEWVPKPLPQGGSAPPALVAFGADEGKLVWTPCTVLGFDEATNTFECRPVDSTEAKWMHRIFVHFEAESPFVYADRMAEAIQQRHEAEASLRFNFFIDSMPTEDIPPLMQEQVNRMLGYALNSKKLKDKLMDTSQLINEINIEYARTMNKIVLESTLSQPDQAHELMIPMKETFPSKPPKTVPETGCVTIPTYDFAEQFSEFSFHSLLTKQEVILTSIKIRTECLKVLKMNLFNVYVSKSSRLDEFEQIQTQASDQVANYLKETWVITLKNSIKNSFKDVGKGWYNMHETNRETYEFSKLKKFLNMIRFVMEDTMRFLVEDSLRKFAKFISNACSAKVTVHGPNSVESSDPGAMPKKVPLLSMELAITEDGEGFEYNTPLPSISQKVVFVFNHALNRVTGINQLESSIMENLFWAYQPQLTSVHPMEPEVVELRDSMEAKVKGSLVAVQQYLDQYAQFQDLLKLDVDAYVDALKAKGEDLTLGELKVEIANAKKELEALKETIPTSKVVGPCMVSCSKVRDKLVAKRERLVQLLVELVAWVPKQAMMAISAKYNAINQELKKPCVTIEEVDAMRKYIEDLPRNIFDLKGEVSGTKEWYKALGEMRYTLPEDDFKEKDKGETWHMKLQRTVAGTEKILESDQNKYQDEMLEEQESFTETLVVLAQSVESLASHTDLGRLEHVAQEVETLSGRLKAAQQSAGQFNSRESLFNLPSTDYSSLKKTIETFDPFYQLWTTSNKWRTNSASWMNDSWTKLDAEQVERDVTNTFKTMFKMGKQFANRGLEAQSANCEVIRTEAETFKKFVPLVHALRNPGMCDRHWDQLSTDLGVDLHPDETFTLQKAEDMGLLQEDNLELITKVSEIAGKEFAIEQALDKMQSEWGEVELVVMEYRETGTFVIKVEETVTQQLDDNIVMTQSMSFSPYKKPFEERIMKWEQQLNLVSEILDEWLALQRQWMYLEPIFSSEDIMQQLPMEGKRFASVDRMWRKTLQNAKMNPLVLRVCSSQKLLDSFIEGNKLLDSVQKGLSDYLETKRLAFSRFFFLSNDELLQILSQAKNPLAVQPHLRKCFEAIENLVFAEDLEISCMISREGEKCPFDQNMYPTGNVENWLHMVEKRMCASVRQQCHDSLVAYEQVPRTQWVRDWPAMVVIAVNSIFWSQNSETAIDGGAIPAFLEQSISELMDLTDLVRGKLSGLERSTMGALITIDVHARDVIQGLVNSEVKDTQDFEWVSQLRYYWRDDVKVDMVQASIAYGYEYLGNTPRLVITPLTDRCYITLMSAMHLNLGGAPAGPAGTGKTETTKDLAKALAKQCVVFNCSDGLDYIAMGKFFKGLASSGAWACFDEFNRIDLEVLSVVAQQILTIQLAIQSKVKRFIFEDTEIDLNPACNVYITMNPGYAGRSELPDNLKALFRPCAMMVPDYALIGEICLYSYGYRDAKNLARKMVATFRLCSEQLSSQDHYDYGMRAVKSVITAAGNLKREFPEEDEEVLLLRGLRDINVPKFLSHDLPLFSGIISDLFPGVKPPDVDYVDLLKALDEACAEQKIQPVEAFINKVIQLFETTIVRHGLMLVGPTMGGKTCCYRALQSAMTKLHELEKFEKVRVVPLNPKSITMGQLYGEFDDNTHEWTDGVLACYMRECSEDTKPDKKWIMFDGPVDAIWIENMNTVLDDNKKLCLVSGEIIQLSSQMTMMFEVEDLAVASPATVSRCGMIYMEPTAMGMEPLLESWLQSLTPDFQTHVELMGTMFRALVPDLIVFLRKNLKETVSTVDHNLVLSLFNIMDSFIRPWLRSEIQDPLNAEEKDQLKLCMPAWFLFALTWSVGGTCNKPGREKFSNRLRQQIDGAALTLPDGTLMPEDMSPYDCCFDVESMGWVDWMSTIPEYKVNPDAAFADIIVPTSDTVCYTYIIDMLLAQGKHVLSVGETGTGKTLNVANKLMNEMPGEVESVFVMFSARTSANQTQDMIDGKMDKRRKGVFGPPSGKKYVIFVDDLNMPQREKYFAQPPIELIRQWMDYGGWYERKPPCAFRKIIDTQFVGAMGPPGGGRNPITNRLLRHFNFLSFVEMSDKSLMRIFDTILSSFFVRGFGDEVQQLAQPIVAATIETYNTIREELLPTPSKSHYTFNLRDLAKVVQGVLRAENKVVGKPNEVLALWLHEATRVFQDRLINDEDHTWFRKQITAMLSKHMSREWGDVVDVDRLIFGDYMVPGADPKVYAQVRDMTQLVKTVEEYLEDLNSVSNAPMKLVMFLDAIEHVSRICRVIRQPLGNALLLGVGGSGRQSLTRLASYMEEFDVFQIEIVKGYGNNEWRDDLRKCLKRAGVAGKETVFLFTDSQIVKESFLEDINNMLNSGEVPNLMRNEDMEEITAAVRPLMQAAGLPITKNGIYAYFIKRVRSLLHVVLAMNPIGDAFRQRLRMFPALVNCCTIDWFREWPMDALKDVAFNFFADIPLGESDESSGKMLKAVVSSCVHIHQSVEKQSIRFFDELRRHNYVTPTSYLELLSTFIKLIDERREEIGTTRRRLEIGLAKLLSTADEVEVMKQELTELQPVLTKTSEEVEQMMVQITKDKEEADETKAVVTKQEEEANEQAAAAKEIADSAQKDLDEALPALEVALSSLKNLSRDQVVIVKSLANPPAGVKLVMEATCIMFEEKPKMVADPNKPGKKIPDYWEVSKKLLNDPTKFLESLQSYDRDNIANSIITKIEPYIQMEEFTPENVERVSKACTCICMWVRAMYDYHTVALSVEPKRKALREAEETLEKTMAELKVAQDKLAGVQAKIQQLEQSYEEAVAKKDALAKQVSDCEVKLERADKLIGGLGGEKIRWQETVQQLGVDLVNVPGDVLVASGTIAYSGPFTPLFRAALVSSWVEQLQELEVPHTKGVNIISVLQDPVQVRSWNIAGLPTDNVSIENGIILFKARRWPLMIDPQGQANKWVKNMEKEHGLDVVKLSEKDFLRTLENAVRFGRAVLLENIAETLDAALEPILLKQTFKQGGSIMIKVGENVIPYHPDFRFYMTTKYRNPHYAPEVSVKVSVLNFFVTPEGLEEQLLGITVTQERPDLAEAKNQLVVNNAKMKKELKEIEDKILFMLSNSQGNILDDEELINTLAQSKVTSNEITEKVAIAEKTEKEIDKTRELYRPVANRVSLLFFCISDLALVDPMYQYSLAWFISLFVRGVGEAPPADNVEERGVNLNEHFTYMLYVNVCRSLFERHKLMFSFLLTIKILQNEDKIDLAEWRFLLAGPTNTDLTKPNPAPGWLTDKCWVEFLNISKLDGFRGFDEHVAAQVEHYKGVFDSNDAHESPLAAPWQEKLSTFQKLCFLRCLRPDKVIMGIQSFVKENIGAQFVEVPPFDLGVCYKESAPGTPLIFVLSSGADPMADLLKLAEEMKFTKKFEKVSLGQGQGPKAEKLLELGMDRGMWVCLQNCHLAESFMPTLERIVEEISPDRVHKDFRLWLTSMPSPAFPVTILQNGVKMTLEPPKGLKSNLIRTYTRFSDQFLVECNKQDAWRKLVFGMSLFHAVIQDRRKFGPLGWNIRYDFTDGDLSVSLTQMKMFLNDYEEIPFRVLNFLFTEINYGGRVTDDKDRRLINNLVRTFCNQDTLKTYYSFSPSMTYTSVECETVKEYINVISEYPLVPKPEIFGLHDNADITCDQNETYDMFATVLSLQPRVSMGKGMSREEVIGAQCASIQDKMPELFQVDEIGKKYPTSYEESMNTVLTQECIRYNGLLRVMKLTLAECRKALKGLVVMSPELEAVSDAVFDNKVPDAWAAKAYPSLKPLSSWVTDLIERLNFIQKWVDEGVPAVYWVSGFFFPQAFLTGTLQNYARKNQMPIDTVSFDFQVVDHLSVATCTSGPEDGCYIRGLFMEGARWDDQEHQLAESHPKELYIEFPITWLKPVKNRKKPDDGFYDCPVYKTLTRAGTLSTTGHSTNFVLFIEVPTSLSQSHWINRGVALFTGLAF